MSDDRPKKSWRELDRSRDKSGGSTRRRDPAERGRERASKTAAYSQYKAKLDGLFKAGGTALPEHMREKLGPQSEDQKQLTELTENLKKDPGEKTLRAFVDAGVPLPEDPRLVMSLLDVQDEELIRVVLERLTELVEDGKRVSPALLRQRLTALETWIEEAETRDCIAILRAAARG